jgi:hypothetical protein
VGRNAHVSGRVVDSLVEAQMVRIWADQAQPIELTQMFYFVRGLLGEGQCVRCMRSCRQSRGLVAISLCCMMT